MRARTSPKRLFIAAASARPFVCAAAAAGHVVVAVDMFCDAETRREATQVLPLRYCGGGFDAEQLRQTLLPQLTQEDAFVYGSGFETQPGLLDEIAGCCTLLGNSAQTVRTIKDPGHFFSLLSGLDIPFPETVQRLPAEAAGWLGKRIGGSGGTHVRPLPTPQPCDYYQRQLPGRPCTLLFLANGRGEVVPVGYNEQWLADVPALPYLYGGAVSQARLPEAVRAAMLDAAQQISRALGLRGLNSLDCMVDGERMWVLEVNPRLSATFTLYDASHGGARLFDAHLQACAGTLTRPLPEEPAQAHLIYYAPFGLALAAEVDWPDWVTDRPHGRSTLGAGEPLCTVTAQGTDAAAARVLAGRRAADLLRQIGVNTP